MNPTNWQAAPVTGQKSQGEPERGVGPCVYLLSGGVRALTRIAMGAPLPVCGSLQLPAARSIILARAPAPSLAAPTPVRQGLKA